MQDGSTHIYNAVAAGLTICLSLNIDSSLNAFAATLKWVIAACRPFRPPIFELVLALDSSQANAVRLLFRRGVGAWWLRLICFAWLVIALSAQVGTALIGLTYSVVPLSSDSDSFPVPRGDGRTSIFTRIGFYDEGAEADPEANLTMQRSNAFEYGIGAINSDWTEYSSPDPSFFFHATTFDDDTNTYLSAISNYPSWAEDSLTLWNVIGRVVENEAGCESLRISDVGSSSNLTDVTFEGYNGTQVLTVPQTPLDYVTYISDTSLSCGARCTQVYAILSTNETELFVCNSTVYEMYDAQSGDLINRTDLSIPDTQARILAGAVGWGDVDVDGSLDGLSTPGRFRASTFPNGSYWSPGGGGGLGPYYVARFTASALEVMNQYGVQQNFTDLRIPGVASQLNVTWTYSVLILALIPGIQALLAFACILVVYLYKVPIHDDSPLAIATLLSPALSHITASSLRGGSKIAKAMEGKLVYMLESDASGYRVKVDYAKEWMEREPFPDGTYH
ncbi:hypothetical protein F4781DRAFT_409725 [Annulohypoxylon bovei var. microspora]|nr:hypothetical protein F4781DRAFT_409725 [Annulohypoxylon bovei var. microspora]